MPKKKAPPATKALCEVCGENVHKYRCPKCRIRYCSLLCYKNHKEAGCAAAEKKTAPAPSKPAAWRDEVVDEEEDKGWRVPQRDLEKLKTDAALCEKVSAPKMRAILGEIDSAKDPEKVLEKLLQTDPHVRDLADDLLRAIQGT